MGKWVLSITIQTRACRSNCAHPEARCSAGSDRQTSPITSRYGIVRQSSVVHAPWCDSSRTSSPDGEPAIAAAKVIPTPLPFEADRVAMHCPEL